MSWTHYSKIIGIGVLLAVALGAAGTAAAVTFDDSSVPDEVEVGQQETITVTVSDPFEERPPGWTLQAETELEDATITMTAETPTDSFRETGGQSAEITLDDSSITEIEIEVSGEVPIVEQYSYENPEQEEISVLSVSDSGVFLEEWSVHRYTEASQAARQAIDEASEQVGEDNDALTTAISLYNAGDSSHGQAQSEAEAITSDAQSDEQTQTFLMIGGGAIVLLLLVGGGVYYYKQQQKPTNKLQ